MTLNIAESDPSRVAGASDHAEANREIISRLKSTRSFCTALLSHAKKNPLAESIPKVQLDEIYLLMDAVLATKDTYFNSHSKIPVWTQPILIAAAQTLMGVRRISHAYFDNIKAVHAQDPEGALKAVFQVLDADIERLKEGTKSKDEAASRECTQQLMKLTERRAMLVRRSKQKPLSKKRIRQALNAEIPAFCEALAPVSEDHARSRGYYGQRCPKCKGYRTTKAPTSDSRLMCFACSVDRPYTFPREPRHCCPNCRWWLSAKETKGLDNGGPCPNCEAPLYLSRA